MFDHRVSLKQFECTRDTQIHGEMHEELHADAERSVEVHGDVGKLDKKFFTMYLENEKRSGGGNIEKIEFDTKPVVVTFHEIEGDLLSRGGGGVLPLWPDRGVHSGLKRVKAKILKNTLKWQYLFTKTLKW